MGDPGPPVGGHDDQVDFLLCSDLNNLAVRYTDAYAARDFDLKALRFWQ
jgi:hypothetical protein